MQMDNIIICNIKQYCHVYLALDCNTLRFCTYEVTREIIRKIFIHFLYLALVFALKMLLLLKL